VFCLGGISTGRARFGSESVQFVSADQTAKPADCDDLSDVPGPPAIDCMVENYSKRLHFRSGYRPSARRRNIFDPPSAREQSPRAAPFLKELFASAAARLCGHIVWAVAAVDWPGVSLPKELPGPKTARNVAARTAD
jgi:hypothetical protein